MRPGLGCGESTGGRVGRGLAEPPAESDAVAFRTVALAPVELEVLPCIICISLFHCWRESRHSPTTSSQAVYWSSESEWVG